MLNDDPVISILENSSACSMMTILNQRIFDVAVEGQPDSSEILRI